MAKVWAHALHILVNTEQDALKILGQLEKGASFDKLAKKYSTCPSAKKGGDLGTFSPGQMVKPFDKAVFSAPLFKVVGPIKTQFGFHLIKVVDRSN